MPRLKYKEYVNPDGLDLQDKVVYINRCTKVVKGGKNLSFSALVVVGDGKGVVGWGMGKAREVPSSIAKGIEIAKRNLIRVPKCPEEVIPREPTGDMGVLADEQIIIPIDELKADYLAINRERPGGQADVDEPDVQTTPRTRDRSGTTIRRFQLLTVLPA